MAENQAGDVVKQKMEQLQAQLEAEQQARKALQALANGNYFSLIDDVFVGAVKDFSKNPAESRGAYDRVCRRTKQKTQNPSRGNQPCLEVYQTILDHATLSQLSAADGNNQSRSSTHLNNKKLIWKRGLTDTCTDGEIAHLVPASVKNANTYWFVTNFLFGGDREWSWEERLRLLHGANKGGRRIQNTGIKHSITNKILLDGQERYFDNEPNVLIIPICNIEVAKSWSGQGYKAIMLIDACPPELDAKLDKEQGQQEDDEEHDDAQDKEHNPKDDEEKIENLRKRDLNSIRRERLHRVCNQTSFNCVSFDVATDNPDVASEDELREAHNLVNEFTGAILYALCYIAPKIFEDDKGSETGDKRRKTERENESERKRKEKREDGIGLAKKFAKEFVESRHVSSTQLKFCKGKTKVRKVEFTDHNYQGADAFPAPDPILLATRAAVQLQRRRGIKLAAAGGTDSDDEQDELSALAEEAFLLIQERNCKLLSDREIIGSNVVF